MKKLAVMLVVVAASLLTGCTGMVDSPRDRYVRYRNINELRQRMLVDDWDYLWLMEQNEELSPYHAKIGRP
jgi:hypothetical protein